MKIAYVTAYFPYGKGESFFIPELFHLANACNVVIVPRHTKGNVRSDWGGTKEKLSLLPAPMLTVSMVVGALRYAIGHPKNMLTVVKKISGGGRSHALRNLAVLPKAVWLAKEIKRLNLTHVHAHWGATTSTMSMVAAELAGVPWSFTCHRWDIYDNNLLALKSRSARFVRFISSRGLSDALGFGVDVNKAVVIPMGVNGTHEPARRPGRATFEIFCAANLVEVKGHKYLFAAIARLVSVHPQIRLRVAGAGPLELPLKALADELGISKFVEFLGQVEQGTLLQRYQDGDVDLVVLASVDLGNGLHEGIPVSLMEAMSYGIPVVSTRTGSIEDLLPREVGLTVPDKDADALAGAISALVSDVNLYLEKSRTVREIIASSWLIEKAVDNLTQRFRG